MRNTGLIWIDLEMTGLNPEVDRILEIATLVTDNNLNIISEGPALAIYQSESQLSLMNEWNIKVHTSTGLLKEVRTSKINEVDACYLTIDFLKNWINSKISPICGSSIAQDRKFLLKYMPNLEFYFNYRYLDVSTIKELMRRWRPDLISGLKINKAHRALKDIYMSVAELAYYRKFFINCK